LRPSTTVVGTSVAPYRIARYGNRFTITMSVVTSSLAIAADVDSPTAVVQSSHVGDTTTSRCEYQLSTSDV